MALFNVASGKAVIYGSGSLESLIELGGFSTIIITPTADTPPGDPIEVDISSALGALRGGCSIIVQGGATAYVGGGVLNIGFGNSLVLNGGILDLRSSVVSVSSGSSITIGPQAGELRIEPQGLSLKNDIPLRFVDAKGRETTQIPSNFTIDFPDTDSVKAVYDPQKGITVIGDGVGRSSFFNVGRIARLKGDPFNLQYNGTPQTNFWGVVTGYQYDFTRDNDHDDGEGGVITCFLAGAMIKTDQGDIAVEDIRVGDYVATFSPMGEAQIAQRVVWVGQGHVEVQPNLPDDEAGWPVRIRRHAFAENVPQHDLCVTAEHNILIEGCFVPVRMLVNGRTIFYDRTVQSYDYWHFKTAFHTVVEANGLLTESYLDTGNRGSFCVQSGGHSYMAASSWDEAAAPLEVSQAFVEPIYRNLQARADSCMGDRRPMLPKLEHDPAFTVLDSSKAVLPLVRERDGRYLFRFSSPCDEVTLLSRVGRPCDGIGPFVDDRRWLGVLVGRVRLFREDGSFEHITAFLSAPQDDGWDVQEATPCRWTHGKARLVLPKDGARPLFLSIELLAGGPYKCDHVPAAGTHVRVTANKGGLLA